MNNIERIIGDLPRGARVEIERGTRWNACIVFPSAPDRTPGVVFGGNVAYGPSPAAALAALEKKLDGARVNLSGIGGAR